MIKMAKEKFNLTKEGLEKVQAELNNLREVERPRIIAALKDARAQGDLSENADYDAARHEQSSVEGRIQELEYMVENVNIIEPPKNSVGLGSVVTIKYMDDDEEEVYSIVGPTEVDVNNNKISDKSPIGSAIVGAKEGDVCTVQAPNGSYDVKVIKIG